MRGLLVLAWVLLLPGRLLAAPLLADVSDHLVAITTGFSGTDILIFGALDEPGDVIVTVRGPGEPAKLDRKSPVLGVWLNTASVTFPNAPSFYALASTGPLGEIASESERTRLKLGLARLGLQPKAPMSENLRNEWEAALVRAMGRADLYVERPGGVTLLGGQLFRVTFDLPTNVPTGTYLVDAYVFRDGIAISAQSIPLVVSKVGAEALLYDFAMQQPALYGVAAILVALLAGWMAHLIFRKH